MSAKEAMGERIHQPILVIVDNERGEGDPQLAASSVKLVRLAHHLTDGQIHVLSISSDTDVDMLTALGVDHIYLPAAPGYSPQVPAAIADMAGAVLDMMEEPGAVLLTSDYRGRAAAAMLGAVCESGTGVDVTGVEVRDGELLAHKSALGGSWNTQFRVTRGFPILALRSGTGPDHGEGGPGKGNVTVVEESLSPASLAVEVVSSTTEARGDRIGLNEADTVVVVGRGTDGDIDLVNSLADVLGAAVGATRVACDEGWVVRSAQIGQTGVSIAPKLYVGLGVSGAIHHTGGIMGSEVMVAVVDDPDAPIVELMDFAVIGDVHEVVSRALEILTADE